MKYVNRLLWFSALGIFFWLLASPFLIAFVILGYIVDLAMWPHRYFMVKSQDALARTAYLRKIQEEVAKYLEEDEPAFQPGDKVLDFDPGEQRGREGIVGSISSTGMVFVNFPGSTGELCHPNDLTLLHRPG